MQAPKPPAPDAATVAAQAAEQARAEASNISQTQMGLNADMIAQRRRYGSLTPSFGAPASSAPQDLAAAAKTAARAF